MSQYHVFKEYSSKSFAFKASRNKKIEVTELNYIMKLPLCCQKRKLSCRGDKFVSETGFSLIILVLPFYCLGC